MINILFLVYLWIQCKQAVFFSTHPVTYIYLRRKSQLFQITVLTHSGRYFNWNWECERMNNCYGIHRIIPVVVVLVHVHVWCLVMWFSGCKAEVSLCAGGGHSEIGWAAEEDRQGCRRLETILGGTPCGPAGEWISTLALLKVHQCWTLPFLYYIVWLVLWLPGEHLFAL